MKKRFAVIYAILVNKYGFDEFNQKVLVHGTQDTGQIFYTIGDVKVIDGFFVNGSGWFIRRLAQAGRQLQTGYIYHYALAMVIGIVVFLAWYKWGF
jgi:NADH-quinone oxidoreductase subunit L